MSHIVKTFISVLIFFICAPLFAATPPAVAVASAHPLATEAGLDILASGGNAFDAAVAVTAVLAVVEPTGSGLGGGGFFLLHQEANALDVMIDGREKAPMAAHTDMYLDKQGQVIKGLSWNGPLAAGIPGIPAAMAHLATRYGRLPLTKSLAPAIRYAQEGFKIDSHYQRMAKWRLEALRSSPEAARIFLHNNKVPEPGYRVKQPNLAATLKVLTQGFDGFYKGPVANKLVQGVRQAGGIWTAEDLANYRIVERKPTQGLYNGITVISAAPPSSGGIALMTILNILAGYDLNNLDEATRVHFVVEAMRRAYRDRAEYLGDPDFVDIPQSMLTDPNYAAGLRASIRADHATPSRALPGAPNDSTGTDTTHFSILDSEGNRVAATLSINLPFGAAFVPPGTGVLLNDEMDDFSLKPGVPNAYGLVGANANAIAPGKRPLSSMSPTFLETDDKIAILGTPGGSRIITMVLLAILDFAQGEKPDSWVSVKRYHHQFLPDKIQYEPDTFPQATITRLNALGHTLEQRKRPYGNMQAILWDKNSNQVFASSDPRGAGKARVALKTPKIAPQTQ